MFTPKISKIADVLYYIFLLITIHSLALNLFFFHECIIYLILLPRLFSKYEKYPLCNPAFIYIALIYCVRYNAAFVPFGVARDNTVHIPRINKQTSQFKRTKRSFFYQYMLKAPGYPANDKCSVANDNFGAT